MVPDQATHTTLSPSLHQNLTSQQVHPPWSHAVPLLSPSHVQRAPCIVNIISSDACLQQAKTSTCADDEDAAQQGAARAAGQRDDAVVVHQHLRLRACTPSNLVVLLFWAEILIVQSAILVMEDKMTPQHLFE